MFVIHLQLYRDTQKLLAAYPDLVSQFSAFLEPGQAVACNCLMDNLLYAKADRCIAALQVSYYSCDELCFSLRVRNVWIVIF